MVEHLLAKEKVAGSNPVFRSQSKTENEGGPVGPFVVSGERQTYRRADVAERQTLRS